MSTLGVDAAITPPVTMVAGRVTHDCECAVDCAVIHPRYVLAHTRQARPGTRRHQRDVRHLRTVFQQCYAKRMMPGMLRRAGVAIVLMATLLLPYGTCQPAARARRHDCCGGQSAPNASVKTNCCIVRSEIPAVVVENAAVSLSVVLSSSPIPFGSAPTITMKPGAAVAVADTSPPPGKSVLRI